MATNRRALIVATWEYQDSHLRRLRAPSTDAAQLANVLGDPAIGGFDVQVLPNVTESVLRRRLSSFFSTAGREDMLLVHFASHGVKDDDGRFYFAAADTEIADLAATGVRAEFVVEQMERSRSQQIILLLDCCYSGAFTRGLAARGDGSIQVQERFGGRGRVVLTASDAMEYAWEGEDLSGEGTPSVFTAALVQGLRTGEADRDGDGQISVSELYDYVYDAVRERTPKQTPSLSASRIEGDLIIAHSARQPVDPLPAGLRAAIQSSLAGVRQGAVLELSRIVRSADRQLAQAARRALEDLAQDDSRRVSEAAITALAEGGARAERATPARTERGGDSTTRAATAQEETPYGRVTRASTWLPITVMACSWALIWGATVSNVSWPAAGAIAGLVLALLLRQGSAALEFRHGLLVTVIWTLAWSAAGWLGEHLSSTPSYAFYSFLIGRTATWGAAGFATGLAVWPVHTALRWRGILLIATGWAGGAAVAHSLFWLGFEFYKAVERGTTPGTGVQATLAALTGGVEGIIGATIMWRQLHGTLGPVER